MSVAPQVGFEPTTHGLTVHRSNQLSYWGTLQILIKLSSDNGSEC